MKAIIIQPDTTGQLDNVDENIEAFHRIIGGDFDAVYSADARVVFYYLDDSRKTVNELATALWWGSNPAAKNPRNLLYGGVIIAGGPVFGPDGGPVPNDMVLKWQLLKEFDKHIGYE